MDLVDGEYNRARLTRAMMVLDGAMRVEPRSVPSLAGMHHQHVRLGVLHQLFHAMICR